MILRDWILTQDTRDTSKLLRRALRREATGTTAPDIQTRPRDQWEAHRRSALRYVMTQAGISFADLQSGLTVRNKIGAWIRGLATVNDKTDVLGTYVPVFWTAYADYRDTDISAEDDTNESYDVGSLPILADSAAVANGWGDITGDDIEAALR